MWQYFGGGTSKSVRIMIRHQSLHYIVQEEGGKTTQKIGFMRFTRKMESGDV